MPKSKRSAPRQPQQPAKPVHERGREWQAEKLTGKRAQRGSLSDGQPRYVYEVLWRSKEKTFEPADCLVGWEADMKKVDEECVKLASMPRINPAAEALKAREAAAKQKAEELAAKRARLQRMQRRRARLDGDEDAESDDEDSDDDNGCAEDDLNELGAEALAAELARLEETLAMLAGGANAAASATAAAGCANADGATAVAAPSAAPAGVKHRREGRSLVWKCFDRASNRCTMRNDAGDGVCGALPESGTGTSGHIRHLEKHHGEEWLHVKLHGERKPTRDIIKDALAAKVDQSCPALSQADTNELHRLVARWIAKCGRPQSIPEDMELRQLLARILQLCKARFRYELPDELTLHRHLQLLGAEGKGVARAFLVRCLASGVKISITGDLWSENGMGLFGIYAHGMPAFKMEKALIALIACEDKRHTADNIDQWTEDALKDIGLSGSKMLGEDDDDSPLLDSVPLLSASDFERLGISASTEDPADFLFKKISDNGANIKAAWDEDGKWAPCVDHTLELCTIPFTFVQKNKKDEERIPRGSIAESYAKARGLVGYLHHSTIGQSDFHSCQERMGLPQTKINQDVRTRWRSSHSMGEQLMANKPAVLEMDKNPTYKDSGEVWGKNKLSFVDWDHIEEGTACLMEAAFGSQLLEGDLYPTSSLVIPTVFRLMASSSKNHDVYFANRDEDEFNDAETNPVMAKHGDLQPKIQEAREQLHERLISRFDSDLPMPVKKFWFVAAMLDPRFKKLSFDGDNLMRPAMRRDAVKWLTEEYNAHFKGKAYTAPADNSQTATATETPQNGAHVKRQKVSSASFFAPRGPRNEVAATPTTTETMDAESPHLDELAVYLSLPQITNDSEWAGLKWWEAHAAKFPNLSVMARQYLGCPASSATVERLFSKVGIAFSEKRQRAKSNTLADIIFTNANVE